MTECHHNQDQDFHWWGHVDVDSEQALACEPHPSWLKGQCVQMWTRMDDDVSH